jgi:two-component system KDP operon response regulator KdpE
MNGHQAGVGNFMITNLTKSRVLLVDDDDSIRKVLRFSLEMAGYEVIDTSTAASGLTELAHQGPDAVILDISLPDFSGIEFLRRAREWSAIPVMVLTVSTDDERKISALDLGADHFLNKPPSIGELLARLRVMLRRSKREKELPTVRFGPVEFDMERNIITKGGSPVRLSAKEHAFLRLLASNPGKVITHTQILRDIWGPGSVAHTAYLHVYMSKLRTKLEDDPSAPKYLLTEPSVGFMLLVDEE